MELLISRLESRREEYADVCDFAGVLDIDWCLTHAKLLLPKEREQIEEACVDMLNRGDDISPDTVRSIVSNYITQNYGK